MSSQNIQFNISLNFDQILQIVRQLSEKEKFILSDTLWKEARENEIHIDEKQKYEVLERLQCMEENPEKYMTLEELEKTF